MGLTPLARCLAAVAATALLPSPAAAAEGGPTPLGRDCAPLNGVRHCHTGPPIPSFDGVPLDARVTLPPTGNGAFPTIVMLSEFGADNKRFEATSPEAIAPDGAHDLRWHYNTNFYASRGYAVLHYTARGFGESCGEPRDRGRGACERGWMHFADQRYEARDTQHLLGRLVDEGIARPDALGVTGASYGAAQAMELALLRDRVRLPDGTFARWTSPRGRPLSIAAAYARHGFSDPVEMLFPNGRLVDWRAPGPRTSRDPVGVPIAPHLAALRATASNGFVAERGADPAADLDTWTARLLGSDPMGGDVAAMAAELWAFHGASGLSGPVAPLLLEAGWHDAVVPVRQALALYTRLRADDPAAPVRLQFGDVGHAPAATSGPATEALADRGAAFLDAILLRRQAPDGSAVVAYPQRCPTSSRLGRPFAARTWSELSRGALLLRERGGRVREPAAQGPQPPAPSATGDACGRTPGLRPRPGMAAWSWPSQRVTLLGRPTVRLRVRGATAGRRLVALLYEVTRRGSARQISQGIVRLAGEHEIVFQLDALGHRIARGRRIALALAGSVPGAVAPSDRPLDLRVRDVALELPVRERPDGRAVVRRVLGRGQALP